MLILFTCVGTSLVDDSLSISYNNITNELFADWVSVMLYQSSGLVRSRSGWFIYIIYDSILSQPL